MKVEITTQDLIFLMQKAEVHADSYKAAYKTAISHVLQLQEAVDKKNKDNESKASKK